MIEVYSTSRGSSKYFECAFCRTLIITNHTPTTCEGCGVVWENTPNTLTWVARPIIVTWDWKETVPLDKIASAMRKLQTWDAHMVQETNGDDYACVVGVKGNNAAQIEFEKQEHEEAMLVEEEEIIDRIVNQGSQEGLDG